MSPLRSNPAASSRFIRSEQQTLASDAAVDADGDSSDPVKSTTHSTQAAAAAGSDPGGAGSLPHAPAGAAATNNDSGNNSTATASASSALGISDAPSGSAVLVLGMAFVNQAFVDGSTSDEAAKQYRQILLQLQKELPGKTIITMCNTMDAAHCAPHLHIRSAFVSSGATLLQELLSDRGLSLSAIYANYFHFDSAARMGNEYGGFFMQMMLPPLLTRGVVSVDTELFVPNVLGVREIADRQIRNRENSGVKPPLLCTPIVGKEYPLFAAIQAMDPCYLDAGVHDIRLGQLDAACPFLRINLIRPSSTSLSPDATQEPDATLPAGGRSSTNAEQEAVSANALSDEKKNGEEPKNEVSASALDPDAIRICGRGRCAGNSC